MESNELRQLVAEIQTSQNESDTVEVKKAHGGTPRKLYRALSAFTNHTGGGIILLGLDESRGFELTGVQDAQRLQEEITHLASQDMEPTLRPRFTVDEIAGHTVVAVEIDEIEADRKPCFYKHAGLPGGAYLRVGNTNRQMTEYEVFGYLSSRRQPLHDEEPVSEAALDDLDPGLLDDYLEELRRIRPGAGFLTGGKAALARRLRIAGPDGETLRPTLAGLLMFGKYPQEFFPQLMITFVQFYGTTEDERTPQGARFVDNRRFEGPVVEMIGEAEIYIMGAMRKASLIDGMFRRDIPEYPREVLREALANAVAHRDYSPYVRGSYIQVRMFADRLEVQSPGGLFGNVTVDNLEEEHSTRNARLMRMMEDLHVVENRGSGINAMLHAMGAANLAPPRFHDRRASFTITLHNHTLMNPEAIHWLNRFAHLSLNDRQRLALVYLRQNHTMDNQEYRRLNRVDRITAGRELRGLVQADRVEPTGVGRWTQYHLKRTADEIGPAPVSENEKKIIGHIQKYGSISNSECRELLGKNLDDTSYILKKITDKGLIKKTGKGRWTRYELP